VLRAGGGRGINLRKEVQVWKDWTLGIFVLVAAIVIVPVVLTIVLLGAVITVVISPFIAIASFRWGEGESFGERFGNNFFLTFGYVLDGIGWSI
jgi:hypothetical protein